MVSYKGLSENTVSRDPFVQFDIWYKEHLVAGATIPESVSLGTASPEGRVSVRTVLLKDYGENGFVFFTNYNSRKGTQLFLNQKAALLFYWPETGRQIRIEGIAEKTSEDVSDSYFKTRQRESQLSAWASKQSSEIPDRLYLEKQYDFYSNKFSGIPVERPPFWGGFRIIPDWFEFWQDKEFRLHDRITYTRKENNWVIGRLSP
jgi:pyridoxamine 5'-phosphate oxidase